MSTTAAAALAKKRVRRQKQIIAVGSVVLLALLGYQLPKLLGGHGNKSASVVRTTAATTTGSTGLAPAAPAPVAGRLPDTDGIVQQRDTSQLVSFGLFKSKDPFVQQLSAALPTAPKPTPIPAPTPKKKTTPKPPPTSTPLVPLPPVTTTPLTTPTSTVPASTPVIPSANGPGVPVTPTPTPTPAPAPTSVLISTNGVCEQVSVNGTFPATEDIFRVVEIAKDGKSIKIAVVGGSYDSGQATAIAKLGEKLTLVNTSDGSRYVIVLQAKCKVVAPTAAATVTTPATQTSDPPPVQSPVPTPAPTSTPIVTDSSDTAPPPTN
jgi:hypothetical protein